MNKTTLKKQAKIVLNKYELNQSLTNSEDYDFLISIFERHPDWTQKEGVGIKDIIIKEEKNYKTRCFYIIRIDNSITDISYIKSIDGKPPKLTDIKSACRYAVRDITIEVSNKVNLGLEKCPITGELLTKENLHIDHYDMTLNELVNKWLEKYNIDDVYNLINHDLKDNETKTYFTSDKIINEFRIFHNANTRLRAVSKKANLSILTRK